MKLINKILILIVIALLLRSNAFAFYNDYAAYLIVKNSDLNYTISAINSSLRQLDCFIKVRSQNYAKYSGNSGVEYILYLPTKEFNEIYTNLLSLFKSDVKFKLILKREASENITYEETFTSIVQEDSYYIREIQKAFPNSTQEQFSYLFFNAEDTTIEKGQSFIKIIWNYESGKNLQFENLAYSPKDELEVLKFNPQYSYELERLEQLMSTKKARNKYNPKLRKFRRDAEKDLKDLFYEIP